MTDSAPLVLIAEDEPLASMALRAQVEALGYQVLGPARDGDEALALGTCFPVDIALLDFRMPRRNGLDAATAMFEVAPAPVVLLSGFDPTNFPEPISRPPIFASVTKPAGLEDLRRALHAAADDFAQWLDADPERRRCVRELHDERAIIARAVATLGNESSPAAAAGRLLDTAARENRRPLDIARDILGMGG